MSTSRDWALEKSPWGRLQTEQNVFYREKEELVFRCMPSLLQTDRSPPKIRNIFYYE
jgi:hypothetical protein